MCRCRSRRPRACVGSRACSSRLCPRGAARCPACKAGTRSMPAAHAANAGVEPWPRAAPPAVCGARLNARRSAAPAPCSPGVQELLGRMLVLDPSKRASLQARCLPASLPASLPSACPAARRAPGCRSPCLPACLLSARHAAAGSCSLWRSRPGAHGAASAQVEPTDAGRVSGLPKPRAALI